MYVYSYSSFHWKTFRIEILFSGRQGMALQILTAFGQICLRYHYSIAFIKKISSSFWAKCEGGEENPVYVKYGKYIGVSFLVLGIWFCFILVLRLQISRVKISAAYIQGERCYCDAWTVIIYMTLYLNLILRIYLLGFMIIR